MRVLGIDCGTERTGFGVIDSDGVAHTMVAAGVIRTNPKDSLALRLHHIAAQLRQIVDQLAPECMAVEEVFHSVNSASALKLAHVRGVALVTAADRDVAVAEYSPTEVKMSVVGFGRAEKQQVQLMIRSILRLQASPPEDAADALAVAVCHATRACALKKMGVAH